MGTTFKTSGSLAAITLCLALAAPALAQSDTTAPAPAPAQADSNSESTQLDEIIVTAQRREENLQKVPVTVTALGTEALQSRGLTELNDLAAAVPGLTVSQSSTGSLTPFLRGMGNNSNTLGSENSVALYVDGVYFSRPNAGVFSLDAIERVEILKGPQGTLFGRNASGGVINVVTKDPSFDPTARGTATYANYDTFEGSIYGTTGITDTLAVDLAVSGRKQNDGFGRNITTGDRAGFSDNFTVKSKLMFKPSEETKFVLSGLYGYGKVGGLGNHYPGTTQGYLVPTGSPVPDTYFFDQRGDVSTFNRTRIRAVSLRAEQDLGFATLASITAYQHVSEFGFADSDYTEQPGLNAILEGYTKQFTQELQLTGQGEGLNWVAGLFYYQNRSAYTHVTFNGFGGGGEFDFDTYGEQLSKSYAAYAQATYEVAPRLKVTGGLRYTKEKLRANGRADFRLPATSPLCAFVGGLANGSLCALFPQSETIAPDVGKVTWKGAVDYDLNGDALLYASVSRSFKSGQFSIIIFPPGSQPTRPEVLTAYEAGFKSNLLDRRVRLNGAVFRYDIDSPQVQLIQNGAVIQSNAGTERIYGAELEGEARVTNALSLRASATYLDAKYTSYPGAPSSAPIFVPPFGTAPTVTIDATGNRPLLTPKFSYAIGADYRYDTNIGEFKATVDFSHNSGFFWEADNILKQKPYGLLDARLRYAPNDNVGISFWGKNLTDEHYASIAVSQQGPTGYPYVPAPPRTYGITVDFNF